MRMLLVADDLTGAADAAAALAGAGAEADVLLTPSALADARASIVSVDLDTRRLEADAAAATVAALAAHPAAQGAELFKKIDSTLRGHIAPELAALAAAREAAGHPATLYVLTPAHPALGRRVQDGQLFVHGEATASLPPLAQALGMRGFHCVPVSAASTPVEAVHPRETWLCDAGSPDDLRHIVMAARAAARHGAIVWVGSAGLAQALRAVHAEACAGGDPVAATRPLPATDAVGAPARGPTAFLVGSYSRVARAQVRALAADGTAVVHLPGAVSPALTPDASDAVAHACTQGDFVVCMDPQDEVRPDLAGATAARLADAILPSLPALSTLVVCGGDTARALFSRLGATRLRVRASPEDGTTCAELPQWPHLRLLLKAGAFGDADQLVRLRRLPDTLNERSPS